MGKRIFLPPSARVIKINLMSICLVYFLRQFMLMNLGKLQKANDTIFIKKLFS